MALIYYNWVLFTWKKVLIPLSFEWRFFSETVNCWRLTVWMTCAIISGWSTTTQVVIFFSFIYRFFLRIFELAKTKTEKKYYTGLTGFSLKRKYQCNWPYTFWIWFKYLHLIIFSFTLQSTYIRPSVVI